MDTINMDWDDLVKYVNDNKDKYPVLTPEQQRVIEDSYQMIFKRKLQKTI